ncbi:MAG: MarR family transcriptional regulator [Desulfovibrio sp.]|nr:MarR family transcriptional regulator [Desulfovibrio sp.]MBQ4124755.1 MarR family transcriptional regulator [Desulfovibrio sp.]
MRTRAIFHNAGLLQEQGEVIVLRELRRLGLSGIVPSHGAVLEVLRTQERAGMSELARRIGRSKSTATALVDKLVRLGYVTREPGGEDGRSIAVALTPKGRAIMQGVEAVSASLAAWLDSRLSQKEQDELERLLAKSLGIDLPG